MKKEREGEDWKGEQKLIIMKKTKQKSDPSQNGFPQPKPVNCFQCQKEFFIKFVIPQQNYSQKNNWEYWTGQKSKQKICDSCLKKLYYDKLVYWKLVKDLRRRQQMRTYIYHGIIS